ncbi:MAG: ABC transporter permease [Ruminococcaceae bacterium]|nr:ABC transporter permease [Oscillospiraceae bacterium]
MKRYNVFYFIFEALKGMKRNGVMAFASIAVLLSCLLVIGGFSLIVVNINLNLEQLGNLNEMVAFCESDADDATVERIKNAINALDNVDGLIHATKEEQLKKLQDENPTLYGDITEEENPLSDSFTVTYEDNSKVPELAYQIKQIEGVRKVRNNLELANKIEGLKNGIMLGFVWFLAILFVVSVFIIINTIKLSVFSRRKEISIMRYIGATNWFITLPFIFEGIFIGLASGIGSFFILKFGYSAIVSGAASDIQMISFMNFSEISTTVLLGALGIGIVTGVLGGLISLGKYLKD